MSQDEESHYTAMKESIHQQEIAHLNKYASNIKLQNMRNISDEKKKTTQNLQLKIYTPLLTIAGSNLSVNIYI